MTLQQTRRPGPGGARRSDAGIRAIAERLVWERDRPPATRPDDELSAAPLELAPAHGARVATALVELAAVGPADTMRAEREAAGGAGPWPQPGRGSAASGDEAADDARGGPDGA